MGSNLPSEINKKIRKANLAFRKQRRDLKRNVDFFATGSCIDVSFRSKVCVYDQLGCCYVCDYGICEIPANDDEILNDFINGINNFLDRATILLSTNGSILDQNNISTKLLERLLNYIYESKFEKVIIETHVNTINKDIVAKIKDTLKGKYVYFELGLETMNDLYRKECLDKILCLTNF